MEKRSRFGRPAILTLVILAGLSGARPLAASGADPAPVPPTSEGRPAAGGEAASADSARWEDELRQTENSFASTMAQRNFAGFVSFLSEDAVFAGRTGALRGREQVAAAWKKYYDSEKPPFSWRPEQVYVLSSGDLGMTSGPVFDPEGKQFATFSSIWRREGGKWRIVFDRGCTLCPPDNPQGGK